MIRSMTGFGRGEAAAWTTEVRSVNHRFADIAYHIPRNLSSLENRFKEVIKKRIKRGRLDVSCRREGYKKTSSLTFSLDEELADQLYGLLSQLNQKYGSGGEVDLSLLASFREIFTAEEESPDLEQVWEAILPSLEEALESLDRMRQVEGENLLEGLKESLLAVEKIHGKLTERAPLITEAYRERLAKRLSAILPKDALDQDRLMQEVALFAERCDISEELTRLISHVKQFYAKLDGLGPHGRELEFLLQEINREINTIGSKGNDTYISQWAVECKGELEKMREQVQNIE